MHKIHFETGFHSVAQTGKQWHNHGSLKLQSLRLTSCLSLQSSWDYTTGRATHPTFFFFLTQGLTPVTQARMQWYDHGSLQP